MMAARVLAESYMQTLAAISADRQLDKSCSGGTAFLLPVEPLARVLHSLHAAQITIDAHTLHIYSTARPASGRDNPFQLYLNAQPDICSQ